MTVKSARGLALPSATSANVTQQPKWYQRAVCLVFFYPTLPSVLKTLSKKRKGDSQVTVTEALPSTMLARHSSKALSFAEYHGKNSRQRTNHCRVPLQRHSANPGEHGKKFAQPGHKVPLLGKDPICRVLHMVKQPIFFPVFINWSRIWYPTQINITSITYIS